MPRLLACVLFLFAFSFCACSKSADAYLQDELTNRGPVALSATNPYIGPNLYIAKEMKDSAVFRGFIHYRGTPDAIEVRRGYFKPVRVYLFYLSESEAYLMEERGGDWLVRGPDKIPAQLMASFINVQPAGQSAPLALDMDEFTPAAVAEKHAAAEGSEVKSLRKVPTREQLAQTGKTQPPLPLPPRGRKPPKSPPPAANDTLTQDTAPTEESASGDLIHKVSFPGENLRVIANWYTGDINNTGRIARINGIEKADSLKLDTTVRIPRYLLKNTRPLPQSEIARFNAEGPQK